MIAVLKEHLHLAELFLEEGAEVNTQDMNGWTPLMRVIERGNVELASRLLEVEGIDINMQSNTGTSALHVAAAFNQFEITQLLLHHGARIDLEDAEGNTALILAEKLDHQDIAALLRK